MSEERLEHYLELKRLIDTFYDVQDVRIRTANRLRLSTPGSVETTYPGSLKMIEKEIEREIQHRLDEEPIYVEWLRKVKGIGPCLGGGLITNISITFQPRDSLQGFTEVQRRNALKTKEGKFLVPVLRGIEAFPTVSKLWAYFGLDVRDGRAPRRKRGQKINWNPKMRVLAWKIGKSFVRVGGFYRDLYLKFKDEYLQREDLRRGKGWRGHVDAMARRKTVKLFLQHLWVLWRQMEGLPITSPYVIDKLGHKNYIPPPERDSQYINEAHGNLASHNKAETHWENASRDNNETHNTNASQDQLKKERINSA